jgi:hypothetical protein
MAPLRAREVAATRTRELPLWKVEVCCLGGTQSNVQQVVYDLQHLMQCGGMLWGECLALGDGTSADPNFI